MKPRQKNYRATGGFRNNSKIKNLLPPFRVRFGAGFAVLIAVAYFFDENGILLAMLPAIVIHELAHMAALFALGCPPRALDATLSGFSLDYSGELSLPGEIICALAGPVAGLVFSWLCAGLGARFESEYLLLASGAGCVINLFNLLPARPLDGGKALAAALRLRLSEAAVGRVMLPLGIIVSAALAFCGIFLFTRGAGIALIPAGVWLLILQARSDS